MDADALRRYVALKQTRDTMEDSLADIKAEIAALEARLLDEFARDNVNRISLADLGVTVHLRKEVWASAADGDQARLNAALRAIGQGDGIEERINTQKLSAMVREWQQTGGVPEAVAPALKVSTVYKLGIRRAG